MTPFPRQPALASHPPFAPLATPAHTAAISVTHKWTADSLYKTTNPQVQIPTHTFLLLLQPFLFGCWVGLDLHAQTYLTMEKCVFTFNKKWDTKHFFSFAEERFISRTYFIYFVHHR